MLKCVLFLAFLILAFSAEGVDSRSADVSGDLEGFGCQSIEKFMGLLRLVGTEARKLYKPRFGVLYKGLTEVPAKDIKDCVDKCGSNEKCFVLSWTEDNKCHLQQDGNGVLDRGNFESQRDALTLLGKKNHLQRFRISGSYGGDDEKEEPEYGGNGVTEQTTSQSQTQPIYCPVTFDDSNYVDPNMVIVAGQSSASDCQHYCDVNVECKVSSFRTDQTCWVLNSSELGSEENVVDAPGVYTYLKQDCGI